MSKPEYIPDQTATPFESSFEDFLTARCEQIVSEHVLPHPEYRQYREEINRAAETIRGFLNEGQKQYYYALDSAEGMSLNLATIIVYQQGLKDGLKLQGILKIE